MTIQIASIDVLVSRRVGAVDLRAAAVADREGQDQDADQGREEEAIAELEEVERVHLLARWSTPAREIAGSST